MGGGRQRTNTKPHATPPTRTPPTPPALCHFCAPFPSFLRRQEPTALPPLSFLRPLSVISAQAGTTHSNTPLLPQFIPPPFQGVSCKMADLGPARGCRPDRARSADPPKLGVLQETPSRGEVRWGVGGREPAPSPTPRRQQHPTNPPPFVIPAPQPSFLRRQEPAQGDTPAGGACPWVLSPQQAIVPSVLMPQVC